MRILRIFRGLVLGLTLSAVNLLGAFLTLLVLGGLGDWSGAQFVGLFGLLEVGTGIAFVFAPNAWRLPVVAAQTAGSETRLTLSLLAIPHWAGGVKSFAGALLLLFALAREGATPSSAGLLVEAALILVLCVASSAAVARWGVANVRHDVFQFVLKRPGRDDRLFPGLSASALVLELLFNIGPFPLVKLLPPSVLYRPQMAPSLLLLAWTAVLAAGSVTAALVAWRGRFALRSPRRQQQIAEQETVPRPVS